MSRSSASVAAPSAAAVAGLFSSAINFSALDNPATLARVAAIFAPQLAAEAAARDRVRARMAAACSPDEEVCSSCGGSGNAEDDRGRTVLWGCPECDGDGVVLA